MTSPAFPPADDTVSGAFSLGDEVRGVTVRHTDLEDQEQRHTFERSWAERDPGMELVRPAYERCGPGRPTAAYVHEATAATVSSRVRISGRKSPVKAGCAAVREPSTAAGSGHGGGFL
ncbi:hypothetical protein [Streptomyces sp. NPDC058751]|uniref:hypothetical protein n=1 Tax=Streptomyces sp. NPDC058751 TaxID=3346623 RepID=UPI0036CE8A9C